MLEYTYILHYINASGGIRMKKVLRYLLMTVMAICFSIPCFGAAEAASVALLPLINNVEGGDELANQVFYKNALAVLNSKKGFVVVENDKLTAVINDAKIGNKVPSAATLEKLLKTAMLTSLSLFNWISWMTKLSIPAKSVSCKSTCKAMQLLTTSSPVKLMSIAFTATKPFLKL